MPIGSPWRRIGTPNAAERSCENGPCRSGVHGESCVAMREPQRHSPLQTTKSKTTPATKKFGLRGGEVEAQEEWGKCAANNIDYDPE